MAYAKITKINFFKWITEHYIQLERKTLPYLCKFSGFTEKDGKVFAKVEFSGQFAAQEVELEKIIEQNLFEYFSPIDKKRLFQAFHNKDRYKLTDRYLCHDKKIEMVVLTDVITNHQITFPAHMIVSDNELIERISRQDVKRISFISAMDFFKNLFKEKNNAH